MGLQESLLEPPQAKLCVEENSFFFYAEQHTQTNFASAGDSYGLIRLCDVQIVCRRNELQGIMESLCPRFHG